MIDQNDQYKKEKFDIRKLPICFLVVFGHCGNDWLHSLIDGHEQVLILPRFSFYRVWNAFKCDRIRTKLEMYDFWVKFVKDNKKNKVERKQLFYSEQEIEKFQVKFRDLINEHGIERLQVFYAIHEAYAFSRNIDLIKKRIIVAQEHLPFFFENMLKDFPGMKVLMLMRDPRAVMSGAIRVMTTDGYLSSYAFNIFCEMWLEGERICKKYSSRFGENRIKMLINERLNADLRSEMNKLANWLGIDMADSLLESTFSGVKWAGESCYMTQDNRLPIPEKEFYKIQHVTQRWKSDLSKNEVLMTEFLLKYFMKKFGYPRITKDNIVSRIKGFFIYLLPPRGLVKQWRANSDKLVGYEWILEKFGKNVLGKIWKGLPIGIKVFILAFYEGGKRGKNYFFPGARFKRYR